VPESFWKSQAYAAGEAIASVATMGSTRGSERATYRRIRSFLINFP
jgi:hypothetical protein